MRSAVVAQFLDLKASVYPDIDKNSAPMLIRYEIINKGAFSDGPINKGLQKLVFEVSAHQQYFSTDSKDDERNKPLV
ncbi:MAG: hypothetical protein Q9167_005415 [Letrouitia subvulpina]